MFELNYPAYEKVLASLVTLEAELKEVYESHMESVDNLAQSWYGITSALERNNMIKALSVGSYYESYRYTSGMRKIMEDYQLLIEQLMARREQLGEQLMQDEYVEPDLSVHTEDGLIIYYSQIDITKGNCNMAMIYGNSAAEVVENMMSEASNVASEWVDFGNASEVLEKGVKKINRLDNFISELTYFKSAMASLEYDLIYEMYVIVKELGDTELEFTEFKPPIAEPQQMLVSAEDCRFIDPDEVKKVLSMDAEEWTVDDAIYIAGAWDFYLEQQDFEMINVIVQSLFTIDEKTYCTDMGILPDYYTDYLVAEVEIEKIQLLLEYLDPVSDSKAYQTLYNLAMVEPIRVRIDDNSRLNYSGNIWVSTHSLNKKNPYLTISFTVGTGYAGPSALENREVKVYIYDLADRYPEEVQNTMDDIGLSSEEVETILDEYGLNKSFADYESMSEQEKGNYDALAWLATMAMLPDDIPVPGTYTLPIGLDMTITYSVSVKGTITDGEISTTIEMQKNELKSLTYSKDNADLIINDEEVSVNVKSEIEGLDAKVGSSFELGFSGNTIGTYIEVGETITEIKVETNSDNSLSFIYAVETKVNESASVSSELEIKKENSNDDLPGWKPVGIPILENLPEPLRNLSELPIGLPGQLPLPIPAF